MRSNSKEIDLPNIFERVPMVHSPRPQEESFRIFRLDRQHRGCSWHFHPDVQLSLVVEGAGQRVVGDSLHEIEPGEITLLGANLPHVWRYDLSNASQTVDAVVCHFREDFLGGDFVRSPEMRDIRLLLSRASQGLQVIGLTRVELSQRIIRLAELAGLDRLLELLAILQIIALSREVMVLSSAVFQPVATELEMERLKRVCDFVQTHFHQPLDRDRAADVAHLSPSAFSRFFKSHTGTSFQDYLADVRIGHACRLLLDPDLPVLDVALDSGFSDLSTFHRMFRRLRKSTPGEYRRQMLRLCNEPSSFLNESSHK